MLGGSHSSKVNTEDAATLQAILQKLTSRECIENKLDNLRNRIESVEERIGAIECDSEQQSGHVDVLRADMHAFKSTNSALQKWLETLENKKQTIQY